MTRTAVLSILFVVLSVISTNAQQYYRPYYTQKQLPELQTAPVFLENRTNGYLKVKLEVNGLTYPVEVAAGNEVPDLMLPVGATVKVKDARALVLEDGKTKWKTVKYYVYLRQDSRRSPARQGWLFYADDYLKP